MTQAKAATVAAALINAGFPCNVFQKPDGTWVIHSQSTSGFNVAVGTVNTFITNQSVNGNVAEVEYS